LIDRLPRDPDSVGVGAGQPARPPLEDAESRGAAWRVAVHVCFVVLVFGVWETISGSLVHSFWVSKPSLIAGTLAEWFAGRDFWRHFGITMTEVLNGFALGVVTGVVIGFVLGELPRIGKFFDPYMAALYGIPKTALAPLLILWFGIGLGAKVMLAAIMVFFLVFFNTAAGLRAVDPDLVNMARVAGASRAQILTKVKFPFAFPYVMTGIKVGLPTGLVGAIVAEFISSNQGIGYLIVRSGMFFDTAGVFAGVIVLAVTVFVLSDILARIERHVLRWRPESR
jgi:NitT/TauT family transport system permease protein